jgi:hypothetical protein
VLGSAVVGFVEFVVTTVHALRLVRRRIRIVRGAQVDVRAGPVHLDQQVTDCDLRQTQQR